MKHVLVPLDSSEFAEKALHTACEIVEPGGRITLVSVIDTPIPSGEINTVYDDPYLWAEYGRADADTFRRSLIDRAEAYLRGMAAMLQGQGFTVRVVAPCGDAAYNILGVAQEVGAEAIVMSTHGRSGIGRFVYGSVTQKVLSHAPCPVFVVPARAA